jgi:hypothetical protein
MGSTETGDACAGPTTVTIPPTLPGPSEAEYACCLAKVTSATKDWSSEDGRALAQSEPIVNCCQVLIAAVDIERTRYQQVSTLHIPCCTFSALPKPDLYQHLLCTPWGPPMPPALDWQAA